MKNKAWVEAATILLEDKSLRVKCPECGNSELTVFDVVFSPREFERHLHCSGCKASTAIRVVNHENPSNLNIEETNSAQ